MKRLDNWLIDYCGATYDDEEYVQAVGRKWLVAAVTRVFHPGHKFDSMLILEGKQNGGKSLILREFATIHGRAYFNDSIKLSSFLNTDKIIMKLQGVIIIELAEMASFDRMSDEEKRSIISTQEDIATLKYKNEAGTYPRQFVFAGTRNPTGNGFLTDVTGNRRMWCVTVSDKLDIDGVRKNKEQIWAEAVDAYRKGEKLYLEGALFDKAVAAQKERMTVHPWTAELEELCLGTNKVSDKQIWAHLKIEDRSKWTPKAKNDITSIMRGLGFERSRLRFNGQPEYCWVRCNIVVDVEEELDD